MNNKDRLYEQAALILTVAVERIIATDIECLEDKDISKEMTGSARKPINNQ